MWNQSNYKSHTFIKVYISLKHTGIGQFFHRLNAYSQKFCKERWLQHDQDCCAYSRKYGFFAGGESEGAFSIASHY